MECIFLLFVFSGTVFYMPFTDLSNTAGSKTWYMIRIWNKQV